MNEYEKQAKDFCNECNICIYKHFIGVVRGFPNDSNDNYPHCHFLIKIVRLNSNGTISIDGKNAYFTFDFYGSYSDYQKDLVSCGIVGTTKPSNYDVLSCISGDYGAPCTIEDLISEYGYEIKSEKDFMNLKNMARGLEDIQTKINDFFTKEEIEKLREIQ